MRAFSMTLVALTFTAACGADSTKGNPTATSGGDATTSSPSDTSSPADSGNPTTANDSASPADSAAPSDTSSPTTTVADTSTGNDTTTPTSCTPITLTGSLTYYDGSAPDEDYVAVNLAPGADLGFGEDLPDELWIEFYGDLDQTGAIDLAAGDEANYETCVHCITGIVDIDADAQTYDGDLYQSRGTLTIDASTPASGLAPTITLTNLRLISVTIDEETFESTPVDGPCYDVGTVTLETE